MHLLIFGASTRAAAFSALRAGFQPWCADLFADADLQARCPVVRVPGGCYPERFVEMSHTELAGPWMYTGGLENSPRIIEAIAGERELWGTVELLEMVRDPRALSSSLRWQRVPVPQVWESASNRAPQQGCWLSKPLRSAGGTGIRFWEPGSAVPSLKHRYLQEYIEGEQCSAVFLGPFLLGATRQLVGEPWLHAAPFRYCGSIGPLELSPALEQAFQRLGDALVPKYYLRGLFGVDCVIRDQVPYPVEVNPRYTASVEVIEYASGLAALAGYKHLLYSPHQWSKSHGNLLRETTSAQIGGPALPVRPAGSLVGKAILFAQRPLLFPSAGPWLETLRQPADIKEMPAFADLPHPGEPIASGKPVLTFFVRGGSEQDCREKLEERARALDRVFYER